MIRKNVKQNAPNLDPLHGITLKMMVEDLVNRRGFENLGKIIKIRCFLYDPSISSALKFLRRTDWARKELEQLYLSDQASRQESS
jgi:uncharacterized protein (DUF2132 family)